MILIQSIFTYGGGYMKLAFSSSFFILIFSVYKGIFLGYALLAVLIIFILMAIKNGFKLKELLLITLRGGKKSFIVIQIFVIIGALISIWMAAGTVPAIVYYGIKLLNPNTFILSAFMISAGVSFLMGTSVGTSGTVGIALILIARTGEVNIPIAAGAIIAGAYFGDRCSPMSSSANLVAFLTDTEIYENVKNMLKSSIMPFILSVLFYLTLSGIYPLKGNSNYITREINNAFTINFLVLLPVLIIIVFSILKINVKYSIICSIIVATILGIVVQQLTITDCIRYIFFGYHMEQGTPLYSIIKGGGMYSMVSTSIVLFIASALAGIIEETKMLKPVEQITEKAENRFEILRNMILSSIITGAIGCCQAFTIILTEVLNKKSYINKKIDNYSKALDMENTSVLISALIPWNLSLLLPMTILGTDYSCIPFLFYIYIFPIWSLLFYFFREKNLQFEDVKS